MEQKKFIQVLRKVIREEVKSVIKQELTEILQEGLQSTVNELKPAEKTNSTIKKSNRSKKLQFKENKFSDILNETETLREQNNVSNYAKLMSEDIVMTAKDAPGFAMQRNVQQQTVMTDPESGKTMNVDPVIQKAMNRDYSALMKAIDKKRGN
jgi:hypothetical protein|tara:strand:- start:231 stop:689 length:459 start_codon:yes stop_codon:yes gene_type:complete